jgi:hypothetical protein
MLGRYQWWVRRFDGTQWKWIRLDDDRKTKYRKLAEKRRWQREVTEETDDTGCSR